MRIAIDARYLNDSYSGIAKYSENLIEHIALLDKSSEYIIFIHPSFNHKLQVGDNFRIIPYPAHPISMRTLFSFGRRVKRMECNFLHSLSPFAPLLGIKRKIITLHDLRSCLGSEEMECAMTLPLKARFSAFFQRALFPKFLQSATWILSVSNATKAHLAQAFPGAEHKTIVVHSGVEEIFFQPPESAIIQLACKKLELPQRYILYIGTAKSNKNISTMLQAFAKAIKKNPDQLQSYRFLLALGHDQHDQKCKRLIHDLGINDNVRILGPITEEEKRVLYHRATILYSVTYGEGFGLPIVEAQASGLPVLAGDDGALPEVTGGTAMLVDPHDEDLIAERLATLLLNPTLRESLSEAGRSNVERFSWETTARSVLEVYHLLM